MKNKRYAIVANISVAEIVCVKWIKKLLLENESRFLRKNDAIFALDIFKRSWNENKKMESINGEYYQVTEKVVHEF